MERGLAREAEPRPRPRRTQRCCRSCRRSATTPRGPRGQHQSSRGGAAGRTAPCCSRCSGLKQQRRCPTAVVATLWDFLQRDHSCCAPSSRRSAPPPSQAAAAPRGAGAAPPPSNCRRAARSAEEGVAAAFRQLPRCEWQGERADTFRPPPRSKEREQSRCLLADASCCRRAARSAGQRAATAFRLSPRRKEHKQHLRLLAAAAPHRASRRKQCGRGRRCRLPAAAPRAAGEACHRCLPAAAVP